jgi:hypothetical protein
MGCGVKLLHSGVFLFVHITLQSGNKKAPKQLSSRAE